MATRKFLYGGVNGYPREADPADDIALGGLAMSGDITMGTNQITGLTGGDSSGEALAYAQTGASLSGLTVTDSALNMSSQQITNVADGTVSHHAVNLAQLEQAVITGGTVKELLLCGRQTNDAQGILAACAIYMANQPTAGDTITLTDGTSTRTFGATSGGDVQYTIGASVAATMQNLSDAIEADATAWVSDYTEDLDAINSGVIYIIPFSNAGSESSIYGTWSTQADIQIVDFGGETDYTKKTSENLPTSAPGSTNFGFRRIQANLTPGEIHYCENEDYIDAWDDDANQWNLLSGSSSIPDATSASGGGTKGKVTFDRDYGLSVTTGIAKIEIASSTGLGFDGSGNLQGLADTTAGMELTASGFAIDLAADQGLGFDGSGDLQGLADTTAGMEITSSGFAIDLAASNPALGFDGSGDLEVLADTTAGIEKTASGIAIDLGATNPGLGFDGSGDLEVTVVSTGGVEKTASGLQIKIDDTPDTLDVDADGLKVVGLPSLFKVNGTAVSANVTAPNLDTLTGGGVTTLHSHAGSDEALRIENAFTAAEILATGDPVYFDGTNNQVAKGDADGDTKYQIAGIAKAGVAAAASVEVISLGPAEVLTGATAGTQYYLGDGGGLTTTVPAGQKWVVSIGWAINATTLFVKPQVLNKQFA